MQAAPMKVFRDVLLIDHMALCAGRYEGKIYRVMRGPEIQGFPDATVLLMIYLLLWV